MKTILKTTLFIFIAFLTCVYITDSNAASGYKVETGKVFYNETNIGVADSASFSILNEHLAKDKNNVYCGSNVIVGADPESVSVVGYIYVKDNKDVYYCDRNYPESKVIRGSDPATFALATNDYAKDKNAVYHEGCWNQYCTFTITKIDSKSFQVVDSQLGIIKDINKVYTNSNTEFVGADPNTFKVLYNSYYSKDWRNVYYLQCGRGGCLADKLKSADAATFEVFKEDIGYAMDKNNFYFGGTLFNNKGIVIKNNALYNKLKGEIILNVENGGEAFYISPKEKIMFYLSRPVIAFQVMREQGIGITNENLEKIPVGGKCPSYLAFCDHPEAYEMNFTKSQLGKIFIQVNSNGEAWYLNPADAKRYFLGRPNDAFDIMRAFSTGISNKDFEDLKK